MIIQPGTKNVRKIILILLLWVTLASAWELCLNEVMSLNVTTLEDEDGEYPDWIELYNPGSVAIDLHNYGLSDTEDDLFKYKLPTCIVQPGKFLVIFASDKNRTQTGKPLHTNFKIKSKGETLYLTNPAGSVIDHLDLPPLAVDVSCGRYPDGGAEIACFSSPTPGATNSTEPLQGVTAAPVFSQSGGFYNNSIQVKLSHSAPDAEIRFTTNGGDPARNSKLYTIPISITKTTVLKARAFRSGELPGLVVTHTFFINEPHHLPVISMSTHPDNLFDDDIGIYVEGNGTALGGYPDNPIGPPANYWEEWERPVNLELYTPGGQCGFNVQAGIKMSGKTTRNLPQKSFAVFMRNQYGQDELDYPLFRNNPVTSFHSFVLRNAGTDNTVNQGGVQFRDGLTSRLVQKLDLDCQAYQPCVLYINGEYWGIYSIREKLNEEYLAAHYGIDADKVDLLDDYHSLYPLVIEGDNSHFNALVDYLLEHDLSNNTGAAWVETQMNVDNYLTYMATQIFLANHDGPGHNCKFWRSQEQGSRYRWLLYDTDHSLSMRLFLPGYHYAPDAYLDNTIAYYREENGPSWPNPPESTFLFRKILENENFCNRFINIVADYLNTEFNPQATLPRLQAVKKEIEPEIGRHLERWGGSVAEWHENVDVVQEFLNKRGDCLVELMIDEFNLDETVQLQLHITPPQAGMVHLNSLYLKEATWTGRYFANVPFRLTAMAAAGYRFAGWEGIPGSDAAQAELVITPGEDMNLTARFAETDNGEPIVINEINYNSAAGFNCGDWIELYNPLAVQVNLAGWRLNDVDNNTGLYFQAGTFVPALGYLVVCRDSSAFHHFWPDVATLNSEFTFGLNNAGEHLSLFNSAGMLIDSLTYSNRTPWPWQPDGHGASLALRDPILDNSLPQNWMPSYSHGTPGAANVMMSRVAQASHTPRSCGLDVYPNPFNMAATIAVQVKEAGRVRVAVYDIMGRCLTVLFDDKCNSNSFMLRWDGRDLNGNPAASGVYLVVLQSDREKRVNKILLLR